MYNTASMKSASIRPTTFPAKPQQNLLLFKFQIQKIGLLANLKIATKP